MLGGIIGDIVPGAIRPEVYEKLFPTEYAPPYEIRMYEKDESFEIYAIGILLYCILTGHLPYKSSASLEECHKAHESYANSRNLLRGKENRLLCMLLSTLFAFFFCPNSNAQNTMRINYKDGSIYETPIESIDSITFIEKDVEQHEASLIGDWLWGSKEKGYYEVLFFNDDRTYTGYDYYLDYGFDTWTYGTYIANGIMLNLRSNGYGYRRTYRWVVSALTENALEVMTQMGGFTYYRVQPEIYSLKVGEESYECLGGDYYVFTDGAKVSDNDGKLKGINEGTSYILKYDTRSELIMAYKVIVER